MSGTNVVPLKPQPVPPPTPDAAYRDLLARAAALSIGAMAAADALIADAVASPMSSAGFKALSVEIGKSTGLDAAVYLRQMQKGRATAEGVQDQLAAPKLSLAQNPDPSEQPRPLASLIRDIARAIHRQVVVEDQAALAIALWVVATYGFAGAIIFPRLVLQSAAPRCGKSTLLALLATLVSRPLKADSISSSAMFRIIASGAPPTLLLDEIDTYLAQNEDMRGVLNAGYERTGCVVRSVPTPDGKGWEPSAFPVACPVVLSGIARNGRDRLPPTIADRSIMVILERAPTRGLSGRQRPLRAARLAALRGVIAPDLVAHAASIEATLDAGSVCVAGLHQLDDRACDNWDALLAVAELAVQAAPLGDALLDQAKAAALKLSASRTDATTLPEQLILDIRAILTGQRKAACDAWHRWAWKEGRKGLRPVEARIIRRVPSGFLAAELVRLDDRPWPEFGRDNKGLTAHRLATLLSGFKVAPINMRIPANAFGLAGSPSATTVVRGYMATDLRRIGNLYG